MGLRFLACRSRLRFPPPRSELQFLAWRSGARFRPCRPGSRFLARRSELRVLACRAELTFPSGCPGRDFELRFQDRRSETNYPDLLELSILFRRLSGDALNRWDLRETRSDFNASDFDRVCGRSRRQPDGHVAKTALLRDPRKGILDIFISWSVGGASRRSTFERFL